MKGSAVVRRENTVVEKKDVLKFSKQMKKWEEVRRKKKQESEYMNNIRERVRQDMEHMFGKSCKLSGIEKFQENRPSRVSVPSNLRYNRSKVARNGAIRASKMKRTR